MSSSSPNNNTNENGESRHGERVDADATAPYSGTQQGTYIRYVGDYELLDELGRGGMGVVYRARQISLNRVVAVKMILRGELATPDDVKRFHREANAAASLSHPNIVPIFEVGEHQGQHYYSMQFVNGVPLNVKLKNGPLTAHDTATIGRTLAHAIHTAHVAGVIHRDLKPQNVLLDSNGQPQITDFGLAKRVSDGDLTQSGQIVGTPGYLAPEQVLAEQCSSGTDVYGIGATMYAMVTQRPPFHAVNTHRVFEMVVDTDPIPPMEINRELPSDLNSIILKCLNKSVHDRYPTASDLAVDLTRFLDGDPVAARGRGWLRRVLELTWSAPVAALRAVLFVILNLGILALAFQAGYRVFVGYLVLAAIALLSYLMRSAITVFRRKRAARSPSAVGVAAFVRWRKREERQMALLLIGIPFFGFAYYLLFRRDASFDFGTLMRLIIPVSYVTFYAWFTWRNWRCPVCESFMNAASPKICPICDARLRA